MPKDEPKQDQDIKMEELTEKPVQLPKKPEEPVLLSKYPLIMEIDAELKCRNDKIFAVESEHSNLEIELSECTGVFKQKRRKELQERIALLDRKAEKMKSELSKVLRDVGYVNAAEFYTELFMVREEKWKYEEACKVWQEECVMVEIESTKDSQYYGDVRLLERGRSR